ncbi:sulfurtransferase TusA family protein [Fundidesulfovibrio terrae]|uniref:sulfurtransferase TusA family protein n=1 Tax=Fundidesulfovibrio terrae TaxID=2922866 RepID=UPI001FB0480B|nr:sulfurtransferase TusA family protein [Fundidesulfovibrio terrae]
MPETYPDHWSFDDEFDSGEESCGRVIINLHSYVKELAPGTRLLLISRDPAAPAEFPAWCRMTRNALLDAAHPYYLIELKPELKENLHG